MAKRKARIISDSSEAEAEEQPQAPPKTQPARTGAPRQAKSKAEEAWKPLKPGQKRSAGAEPAEKTTAPSQTKKKKKDKAKAASESRKKSVAERFSAPDIIADTSDEDGDEDKGPAAKKYTTPKGPARSSVPKPSAKPAKPQQQLEESSTESDEESDEEKDEAEGEAEDEEEAEKSEQDDLEALEANPRALRALLDQEEATWADEERGHEELYADENATVSQRTTKPAEDFSSSAADSARLSVPPLFDFDDRQPSSPTHKSSKASKKRAKRDMTDESDAENSTPKPLPKKKKSVVGAPSKDSAGGQKAAAKVHGTGKKDSRDAKGPKSSGTGKKSDAGKEKAGGTQAKGLAKKGAQSNSAATAAVTVKRKRTKADESIEWGDEITGSESDAATRPKKRPCRDEPSDCESSSDSSDSSDSSSDSDSNSDDDEKCTDLVLPRRSGKRLKLKKQFQRVKAVALLAIAYVQRDICIINPFPDGPEKSSDFARRALIQAAKDRGDKEIVRRLKTEKPYWKKLSTIPTQRIPNFRGKVKKATDSIPANVLRVRQGDVDHVQWLQEGIRVIFPHNYQTKTFTATAPFDHPVFSQVLCSVFFAKSRSYGYRIVDHFVSTDPEHPEEREIPAAMLALVSTALYASLEDYRKSRYSAGDFKAELFLDAYQQNMLVLSTLKDKKPDRYHKLMHRLYVDACSWSPNNPQKQVICLLNTDDMTDD